MTKDKNPYETHFVEVITKTMASQNQRKMKIQTYTEEIAVLEKKIESVEQTITLISDSTAITALQQAITTMRSEITKEIGHIEYESTQLDRENIVFSTLQSVCPHVNTVFDHNDYHKREDYFKCTLCGIVR